MKSVNGGLKRLNNLPKLTQIVHSRTRIKERLLIDILVLSIYKLFDKIIISSLERSSVVAPKGPVLLHSCIRHIWRNQRETMPVGVRLGVGEGKGIQPCITSLWWYKDALQRNGAVWMILWGPSTGTKRYTSLSLFLFLSHGLATEWGGSVKGVQRQTGGPWWDRGHYLGVCLCHLQVGMFQDNLNNLSEYLLQNLEN